MSEGERGAGYKCVPTITQGAGEGGGGARPRGGTSRGALDAVNGLFTAGPTQRLQSRAAANLPSVPL